MNCSDSPTRIERKNQLDPGSDNYNPNLLKSKVDDPKISLDDLNQFSISWPYLAISEKYVIKRKNFSESEYTLLEEITDISDTSYVDKVFEYDSYSYQINYYYEGEKFLSLETDSLLSNWVEGPILNLNSKIISNRSLSFTMKLDDGKALIHHLDVSDLKSPIISILNLNNFTWNTLNYSKLSSQVGRLNQQDFIPIGNSHFLALGNFFRNEQNFLGFICSVEETICSSFGMHLFSESWDIFLNSHTLLRNNKIIFLGRAKNEPNDKSYAYIFDTLNQQLDTIAIPASGPLNISTLTELNSGNILHCQNGKEWGAHSNCQIYDIETNIWVSITRYTIQILYPNSILMNDNRVFLFGLTSSEADKAKAQIFSPKNNSWSTTPPTSFSNQILSTNPVPTANPLLKSANGNILVLTHTKNYFDIINYYLEEYNPDTNSWIKIYKLPSNVRFINSITELETGKYLIVYNEDTWKGNPKSAIFYWN